MISNEAMPATIRAKQECVVFQTDRGFDVRQAHAQKPDDPTIVMGHAKSGEEPRRTDHLQVLRVVTGPEAFSETTGIDGMPIDMRPNFGPDLGMQFNVTGLGNEQVRELAASAGSVVFQAMQLTGAMQTSEGNF
jgi:hypothetical protein